MQENKYKFIAAVTGIFLVPFLLLSRHFIYGAAELQKNDTLRYLELRTSTGAGIISGVLSLNYSLSRLTSGKNGAAALKAELAAKVKENPFIYSELALLGPSGSELGRYSAERSVRAKVEYAKSEELAAAKSTLAPAGAVEYGEYTPPALILAEPLLKGGKPEYFLAGRLSLAYVGEVVRLMGRNSQGNFGLVDVGGQIISDSLSMSIVKPGLKAPPEVIKLLSVAAEREAGSLASEVYFRNRVYLVSGSNVAGSKGWIYEIMDRADIPVRRGASWAWRVVLSGILLTVIFGFIAYSLALRWLVPSAGETGEPPAA
jgi:hypothetical protein